jgi:hypothetical protein
VAEEEEKEGQETPPGALTGPKWYREHLEKLEAENAQLRKDQDELVGHRREKALQTALSEAKVEGVSLADVGDLPPDQITVALVKAKAGEKEEQRRAAEEKQAKELGFESVEEYRDVLKAAREAKERGKAEQVTAAQVATSSPGGPPPRKTVVERAMEAHQQAVERGVPADYAQAEFVGAAVRAAMEEHSAPAGERT